MEAEPDDKRAIFAFGSLPVSEGGQKYRPISRENARRFLGKVMLACTTAHMLHSFRLQNPR
jgi:hypothetical protein